MLVFFLCWQSLEYAGFKVMTRRTGPKAALHMLSCAVLMEEKFPVAEKQQKAF